MFDITKMPAPIYINVNKSYRIEYITGEVENLINQVQTLKTQLSDLEQQKVSLSSQLRDKQVELLALYCQQSGSLPP